jgi:hypothetical protein
MAKSALVGGVGVGLVPMMVWFRENRSRRQWRGGTG